MFGIFSVIRLSPSAAILLMAALVTLAGCRILSPNTSTPMPQPPLPSGTEAPPVHLQPPQGEPEHYSAFRPIMQGGMTRPTPTWMVPIPAMPDAVPKNVLPKREPNPDTTVQMASDNPASDQNSGQSNSDVQNTIDDQNSIDDQNDIDELHRRIRELEAQLEEAKQTPYPSVTLEERLPKVPLETTPLESTPLESRVRKPLPVINKKDVHVYAGDLEEVRIEIRDRALFMPNSWTLSAEGEETLRTIAAEIRAYNSEALIDIEGHTDSLMSDPNNPAQKHEIATTKTRAVMDFFVNALRWDVARISTSSFGRNRPIADNGTPEGRARNNRIEMVVRSESE